MFISVEVEIPGVLSPVFVHVNYPLFRKLGKNRHHGGVIEFKSMRPIRISSTTFDALNEALFHLKIKDYRAPDGLQPHDFQTIEGHGVSLCAYDIAMIMDRYATSPGLLPNRLSTKGSLIEKIYMRDGNIHFRGRTSEQPTVLQTLGR